MKLWNVEVAHRESTSLWILASTAERAGRKAIRFCQQNDDVQKPVVEKITLHGTIDVF